MISASPTVSVIIPSFNCARYLPEAVESVRRQTVPAKEIVIVDDGSADDTPDVVARLGESVVYVRHAHQGIGATRNRGVQESTGDHIAFLDADDLFMPTKIARQLEHLQTQALDISLGRVEEFVSADLPEDKGKRLQARPGRLAGYVASAMLISRKVFERVGPFDSSWRVGEFADWYMRAADAGFRTGIIDEVVLRRRLHGDNTGIRERDSRVDFIRIAKNALDRRRQNIGNP